MGQEREREGVENVWIEDVDGNGPFAGVAECRGWDVLRKDPTTDSVCEGDGAGSEAARDVKSVVAT